MELLIEHRADPNAQASEFLGRIAEAFARRSNFRMEKIRQGLRSRQRQLVSAQAANKEIHYYPIHDAVWFNRKESVRILLRKKADVFATGTLDSLPCAFLVRGYVHDR